LASLDEAFRLILRVLDLEHTGSLNESNFRRYAEIKYPPISWVAEQQIGHTSFHTLSHLAGQCRK